MEERREEVSRKSAKTQRNIMGKEIKSKASREAEKLTLCIFSAAFNDHFRSFFVILRSYPLRLCAFA